MAIPLHPAEAAVPEELRTDRVLLRPLRISDVELDYDAVMSSQAMLRIWSQSDWPADDFTPTDNLMDLERHEREHLERVAFTYTVLSPDASRCLGCAYLTPLWDEEEALVDDASYAAHVGFWVRASELRSDLDRHLLDALRAWFASDWRFDRVVFSVSRKDERQVDLLTAAGLERRLEFVRAKDGRRCVAFVGKGKA